MVRDASGVVAWRFPARNMSSSSVVICCEPIGDCHV